MHLNLMLNSFRNFSVFFIYVPVEKSNIFVDRLNALKQIANRSEITFPPNSPRAGKVLVEKKKNNKNVKIS